jgi:hypothetical protein
MSDKMGFSAGLNGDRPTVAIEGAYSVRVGVARARKPGETPAASPTYKFGEIVYAPGTVTIFFEDKEDMAALAKALRVAMGK